MKRLVLIAVAAILFAAPASANAIFTFSNATLAGGELTGTITTNDALTSIVDLTINAPAADVGSFHFDAITYVYADLTSYQIPSNSYIRIDTPGHQLQLAFGALSAEGATFITNSSYDFSTQAGSRYLTGGSLVRAPEPASWTLALAGLGLIGFGMMRRMRPAL